MKLFGIKKTLILISISLFSLFFTFTLVGERVAETFARFYSNEEQELIESGFLNINEDDFLRDDKEDSPEYNYAKYSALLTSSPESRCLNRNTRSINLKFKKRLLPAKCSDDISVIYLIKSSIYRNALRQVIRKTWGRELKNMTLSVASFKTRRLFLIGSQEQGKTSPLIEAELLQNRDVLRGAFKDTYKSVTSKVILGMKFVKKFCTKVKYVIVIDDDAVLFPWNLYSFLKNSEKTLDTNFDGTVASTFYAGHLWQNAGISRQPWSKYRILREEFACNKFPPYPSGAAYVLNFRTLVEFYQMSTLFRTFFLDDAYFGSLAAILKVPLTRFEINQLSLDCTAMMQPHSLVDNFSDLIVCHGVDFATDHNNIWLELCFNHSPVDDQQRELLLFYCSSLTNGALS